jgi:hypothetical protein
MSRKICVSSRTLLFLAAAFGCRPAIAATPRCVVPPSGLVSWWTGDSDESDLYGVNNPSAVSGVTLVAGEVANGFTFGSGGHIDIPDSTSLDLQKFTFAAWVMPKGPGPNNDQWGSAIVLKTLDNNHDSVGLKWRANPDDRFVLGFGDESSEVIYSTDTFPPGVFYFVAATYDGHTFRLYVNGVLEGSHAETKTIPYASAHTWGIGSADAIIRSEGFPRTWNGIIDEVQAFNVALPQAKLLSIYKAGAGGTCKAPVLVTPTSLGFAPLAVGSTSLPKTVTIVNNRNVDLTMLGFGFTGTNPGDFAESSTTCGSTLTARKSCKVGVTFKPDAIGKRSAVLDVNDSDATSPQTVKLSGTGK